MKKYFGMLFLVLAILKLSACSSQGPVSGLLENGANGSDPQANAENGTLPTSDATQNNDAVDDGEVVALPIPSGDLPDSNEVVDQAPADGQDSNPILNGYFGPIYQTKPKWESAQSASYSASYPNNNEVDYQFSTKVSASVSVQEHGDTNSDQDDSDGENDD